MNDLQASTVMLRESRNEGLPGTASVSYGNPSITGLDWAVWYVPEPASVLLLLLTTIAIRARA